MCGIIGYIGQRPATSLLLDGLQKLEYRGYDSAGIALVEPNGIHITKARGRIDCLRALVDAQPASVATIGIGHTRWATHGAPSDANAHPHASAGGNFVVVHNGIIENFAELRSLLVSLGYQMRSMTDTEVLPNLLEHLYDGDILQAIARLKSMVRGSYALGILTTYMPQTLLALRMDSPLVAGCDPSGCFIASDITALLEHTREFFDIDDQHLALLTRNGVRFVDIATGAERQVTSFHVDWDVDAASKGGFQHYMHKEIFEQPSALSACIHSHINDGRLRLGLSALDCSSIKKVYLVACGSAYHAALVARNSLRSLAHIEAYAELASEFRYNCPRIDSNTLVILVSQSGETADSVAALRYAKHIGARTLSVVNVVGSTLARESEFALMTNAGPEIAVATTKAYSCQVCMLIMLAAYLGRQLGTISERDERALVTALEKLPAAVGSALESTQAQVVELAQRYHMYESIFFVGRGVDFALAQEASLKLKEISYIHSESYAAGELKHGSIALITGESLVVAIATDPITLPKTISNLSEVRARGACTLLLTSSDIQTEEPSLCVDQIDQVLMPLVTIIPLQLLAYHIARLRGLDIDKPRNLAKSVTVE